jgi:DNA-binding PadR family transcriptional regulator
MGIVKTIHLSDAIEVKRKPPKLKFDILEFLALRGNCSKSDLKNSLGRYYPDISHSVDDLSRTGHLRFAGKRAGRGKVEVYYAITEKGLKALLYTLNPIRFWEILYGYCQNNDEIVKFDKIDEFYQIAIRKCLKYANHGFSYQLDIFDNLCNNWFQNTIVKRDSITTLQKVIEILASCPKITLEELLEKIDESKTHVEKILRSHSSTSNLPEEEFSFTMITHGYDDFLIQNIIITTQDANYNKPIYELSLFGVMLCLAMLRYNDMDGLRGGLYHEYSFEKYYDIIALNYEHKLPLIFRKWNHLKGILGVFTYYNFDIVLHGEVRSNSKRLSSVMKGGNKQLIEGIREIILDNKESISDFVNAGSKVLGRYMLMQLLPEDINRTDYKRVYWLHEKLKGLLMLLDPIPSLSPTTDTIGMMGFMKGTCSILKDMEGSFADEIAAFYYMNLCSDSDIRVSEPRKYYHSKSFKPLNKTPRQGLSLFVEQDKERPLIKEWLFKWRDDLTRLQSEVLDNVKAIV